MVSYMLTPLTPDEFQQFAKLAEKKKKEQKIHLTPAVAKEHLKQQLAVGAGSAVGAGIGFGVKEMLRGKKGDPREIARVMELVDRQIEKQQKKLEALSTEGLHNSFHAEQTRKQREREQERADVPGPGRGRSSGTRTPNLSQVLSGAVRSATSRKPAVGS